MEVGTIFLRLEWSMAYHFYTQFAYYLYNKGGFEFLLLMYQNYGLIRGIYINTEALIY